MSPMGLKWWNAIRLYPTWPGTFA